MASTSPLSITNRSLGTLERLPAELRNTIYELAINTEHELEYEADFDGPCRQRQSLHLVSKQVYAETKGFLEASKNRPCRHVKFVLIVPEDEDERDNMVWNTAHTIDHETITIRFVTGHLAGYAPLAVECCLRVPANPAHLESRCDVFGASQKLANYVDEATTDSMDAMELSLFVSRRSRLSGTSRDGEPRFEKWYINGLLWAIGTAAVEENL